MASVPLQPRRSDRRYEVPGTMNAQPQPQDQAIHTLEEETPRVSEHVIVFTPKFRCLGYLDGDGIWRYAFDGVPIPDVLKWTRNRRP